MKQIIPLFIVLFLLGCLFTPNMAQAQNEQDYFITYPKPQYEEIIIYIDTAFFKYNVKHTNTVEYNANLNVSINLRNPRIMNMLYQSGRYSLKMLDNHEESKSVLTTRKQTLNEIIINNVQLQEKIYFTISIPKNVAYTIEYPSADQSLNGPQ